MARRAAQRQRVERLNARTRHSHRQVEALGVGAFGSRLWLEAYRLGNGLRTLVLPDPSAPVVAYHTWYQVGSRHEDPDRTGLAHFFEHMMFNETKHHGLGEFDRLMEAAGADTNAATFVDWTYYYESLPASEWRLAVELESDRMHNLIVRKPQVEREREVVANERRVSVEDSVSGATSELLYRRAFGRRHPHGWPTIGWMEHIDAYSVRDCQQFYRTWYAPNNAVVVVVGDLDPEELLHSVRECYGSLKPSSIPSPRRATRSQRKKEVRASLRWPTPTEKLTVGWLAPALADAEHAALEVVDEVLTGGRSSRLRTRLHEDLGWTSSVSGGVTGFANGGMLELWVSLREGFSATDALAIIDDEVARLQTKLVTDAELEKVKNRAELFFWSDMETVGGKASQLGHSQSVTGNPLHSFQRLQEIRAVTAEDVRRVARKWLVPQGRTVVAVRPGKQKAS